MEFPASNKVMDHVIIHSRLLYNPAASFRMPQVSSASGIVRERPGHVGPPETSRWSGGQCSR